MGFSALIAFGATVGLASVSEQRKQRKSAERAAEQERQTIEALQREVQAEESPMPLADDDAARRAKRRSITGQMRRRGRQSTILTGDVTGDPLGT